MKADHDIFGPFVAQAALAKPQMDLGIVDQRRIGEPVFPRQVAGMAEGDTRGALGFLRVDTLAEGEDRVGKLGDLAPVRGRGRPRSA